MTCCVNEWCGFKRKILWPTLRHRQIKYVVGQTKTVIKGKVPPRTGHEDPESELRCSSTLSLKGEFAPEQATKRQMGNIVRALLFL